MEIHAIEAGIQVLTRLCLVSVTLEGAYENMKRRVPIVDKIKSIINKGLVTGSCGFPLIGRPMKFIYTRLSPKGCDISLNFVYAVARDSKSPSDHVCLPLATGITKKRYRG